jgi:hypothetical protein
LQKCLQERNNISDAAAPEDTCVMLMGIKHKAELRERQREMYQWYFQA